MGQIIRVNFKKKKRERYRQFFETRMARLAKWYDRQHRLVESALWMILVSLFALMGIYVCFILK